MDQDSAVVEGAPLRAQLAGLEAALAALKNGGTLRDASVEQLLLVARAADSVCRQAQALGVTCAGLLEKKMSQTKAKGTQASGPGFGTAAEAIRDITGSTLQQARDRVALGSEMVEVDSSAVEGDEQSGVPTSRVSLVAASLSAGLISEEAAQLISATLKAVGARDSNDDATEDLEAQLVGIAIGLGILDGEFDRAQVEAAIRSAGAGDMGGNFRVHLDDLRKACRMVRRRRNDARRRQEDRRAAAQRWFTIGAELNGLVSVRGQILPEVAGQLEAMLNAITSPRVESPASHVDQPPVQAGSGRSPGQKRHDALATILRAASAAAELPEMGGAPVTVLVRTTVEDLENRRGGVVFMNQGEVPVSADAVEHSACTGSLQFYAEDAKGRLLALGNQQRVFTAHQRRAILARDGGCVIPGCTTPGSWCEIHHVTPHARGGQTHTDNGVALCYYHHRHIDQQGWSVRMVDGVPQVRAPKWKDPTQQWWAVRPPDRLHELYERESSLGSVDATYGARREHCSVPRVLDDCVTAEVQVCAVAA